MRKSIIMGYFICWVCLRAEADEAVVKQINLQRVEAGHECEDSEVILEAIEEVGVDDVLTSYVRLRY